MNIHHNTTPATQPRSKSLKVTLPLQHHLALHRTRLMTGQTISETVRVALDEYFDKAAHDRDSPQQQFGYPRPTGTSIEDALR